MRRRLGTLVIALAAVLAGCAQPTAQAPLVPVEEDDGVTVLDVEVVDGASEATLGGVDVTLTIDAAGFIAKKTDQDGLVRFSVSPAPACSLWLEREGYRAGVVPLDCLEDRLIRIRLFREEGAVARPAGDPPVSPPAPDPEVPLFLLAGHVYDADRDVPLGGIDLRLDPVGLTDRTGPDGAFGFLVPAGAHTLTASSQCWIESAFDVDLDEDMALDIAMVATLEPPPAPTGLRATPGPGPGMLSLSWDDVPGATGFRLVRNGQPFHELGHSLAYGIPGAAQSDRFAVAATACGQPGALTNEVSGSPLPGNFGQAVSPAAFAVTVQENAYPASAPNGSSLGQRSWRTVSGSGNCCENYLAVTQDGRILDLGGSDLGFSDDEGRTWQRIRSPLVLVEGEGAVAAAPDGDIVAFDWATYNADTAFAYRYTAATGSWASLPVPKPAFFDRPWISVIKGPFVLDDIVIPYVSIVQGFSGMLVSYDGLHYVEATFNARQGDSVDLRALVTAPDLNRDWMGAASRYAAVSVDNGLGYVDPINNAYGIIEPSAAIEGTPIWAPVQLPNIPGQVVRIDSAGTVHALAMEDTSFVYSWSRDGGRSWDSSTQEVGGDLWQAELRANAALDQAIVAVHVAKTDGADAFRVYRFRGLSGDVALTEVLEVGLGDYPFRGNLAGGGERFDFMTAGILPSGRAVLSFGDSAHLNPSVAIEM